MQPSKPPHWTDAQYWRSIVTGETITAGQLIERGRPAGISPAENSDRNRAIEAAELRTWAEQPDVAIGYYHFPAADGDGRTRRQAFFPSIVGAYVSTWPGTKIGTITRAQVYRHNFSGRFISLRMTGTNGAEYHGRASWDGGSVIRLRKVQPRAKGGRS